MRQASKNIIRAMKRKSEIDQSVKSDNKFVTNITEYKPLVKEVQGRPKNLYLEDVKSCIQTSTLP